ncbi:conjugal transfer nickase/helicase domain-containing protein, partial [Pseudomonas aeruginosa]
SDCPAGWPWNRWPDGRGMPGQMRADWVAGWRGIRNLQDWQWVQKRFERLQLHRKQPSGLNIWTCEVTGARKSRKLHGYLLIKPEMVFEFTPPNNPYLFSMKFPGL